MCIAVIVESGLLTHIYNPYILLQLLKVHNLLNKKWPQFFLSPTFQKGQGGQTRPHGQGEAEKNSNNQKKVKIPNFFFTSLICALFLVLKRSGGAFATLKAIVDFDPFLAGKWG